MKYQLHSVKGHPLHVADTDDEAIDWALAWETEHQPAYGFELQALEDSGERLVYEYNDSEVTP